MATTGMVTAGVTVTTGGDTTTGMRDTGTRMTMVATGAGSMEEILTGDTGLAGKIMMTTAATGVTEWRRR